MERVKGTLIKINYKGNIQKLGEHIAELCSAQGNYIFYEGDVLYYDTEAFRLITVDDTLYAIKELKFPDPYDEYFTAYHTTDSEISFEGFYYNCGTNFIEMIGESLANLSKEVSE
ncbi:hypothetical protein BE882_14890 [Listeria monocytogenes]|nr:hypothetical protein [Listeria monocytogenes]EAE6437688.1 hypothetical protein [Listeria monocytogenes]EAG4793432.1 hypothetical protein [Listeria monocytogenes]